MTRQDNLICIGHVYGAGELALLQAAFDAAEVPLLPDLPNAGVTASSFTLGDSGIRLLVPRGHVEEALALAAALDPMSSSQPSVWTFAVVVFCLLWSFVPPYPTGYFPRRQSDTSIVALEQV
ncbi:hypothetical protein [Jannaschia marina]|uniref:hypothetical protein n=1 Tax=Jannaschia marina TaxID=2741674 RepID=UPI0015C9DD3B|nr:hypothetical protein [Jannaschia marina]